MEPVYLDYAATTPVREEVRTAMAPYLADTFGNPSSIHRWGRAAEAALENARAEAAEAVGARPREVRFVRGGTESDNMAILGSCSAHAASGSRSTLVITTIEHSAVLGASERAVRDHGARLVTLPVSADGTLDLDAARRALAGGPTLVSVMWVNNEAGIVLPVGEVAALAAEAGATMHSDAAQAVGKVPVDVREVPVDLLSATGHKIYGPKGTGLLFVRDGTPVSPLLHGGGQEQGLRPGTEDVAGAVGFATAMRLAVEEREAEAARLTELRRKLEAALLSSLDGVRINAGGALRAPHILSVGIDGVEDGNMLLMALDLAGLAVSGGSACMSGTGKGSHVIEALYGSEDSFATVRFSLGRGTDGHDVEQAVRTTVDVVQRMRAA